MGGSPARLWRDPLPPSDQDRVLKALLESLCRPAGGAGTHRGLESWARSPKMKTLPSHPLINTGLEGETCLSLWRHPGLGQPKGSRWCDRRGE